MQIKPTVASFLIKYLGAITPLYIVTVYSWLSQYGQSFGLLILLSVFPLFAIAWTLRNREVTASTGLFMLLTSLWALYIIYPEISTTTNLIIELPLLTKKLIEVVPDVMMVSALISSVIVLVLTELYRRSITYIVDDTGIVISGGIIRRQEHTIPYDKIGRVILEQGVLGRTLNYGTIIPVGVASWGEEYYTRAIGGGASKQGVMAGIAYARTLQEISRDPLKVLYGVPNPEQVYNIIQEKVTFTYTAEKKKLELLESIDRKLDKN